MKHYERLIQECDAGIRAGHALNVSKRLHELNTARVPREYRLPLAQLCRRVGLYALGMRLLSNIIHSSENSPGSLRSEATPRELSEYAVLLIRIGAVSEGMRKLGGLNASDAPEALLYRAFGHFGRWEYREAIQDLEIYLATPLAPYASLVGRMNLALAYVEVRDHRSALRILGENIEEAASAGHRQLQSNCHGLRAQAFLQQGDFSEARAELATAKELISLAGTNDHRFLRKLGAILSALEANSVASLDELREHSIKHHEWESLRESDLYRLKIDFSQERFHHLYFGTPFEHFRELACRELGARRPEQASYLLGPESAPCLDLRTAQVDGGPALSPGQKCHQLVEVLLRDFYQPLRIAGLFSELFPSEQFNISSSPVRVRQLLWRTRRWLEGESIPVALVAKNGFYSLHIEGNFSFRIPLERKPVTPHTRSHDRLVELFGDAPSFLAKEAQRQLGLPKSTVRQILKSGIQNGTVERLGETNSSAQYRILPAPPLKKAA